MRFAPFITIHMHFLSSLPVHNWQEHDDNDLAQARKEIFLDVFKGFL